MISRKLFFFHMVLEDTVDLAVMKARRVDGLSEQPGELLACVVQR